MSRPPAAAAPALPELLKLTESLGYVVIFSGDSAAGRETASRGLAGQVFDLDVMNLPADDSEALRKILGLARKLRITRSENGLPPVN